MPGHGENNQTERNQDYEQYRKKFNRLIICRDCTRSFDTKEDEKVFGRTEGASVILCKFCGSDNIIIKGRHIFKYYCPACEKSYISEEKQTKCKVCQTEYLHMRRISDLSKSDRLEVRKARLKKLFKNLKGRKKGQTAVRPNRSIRFPSFPSKRKKDGENAYDRKKKKKSISFRSRRKEEEMPTY